MRIALAAATAAVMFAAAPAVALPFADIGSFATYTFGVTFQGTPAVTAGDTLTITGNNGINLFGTEELAGVSGFTTDVTGLSLVIGTGNVNNGQAFSSDFDRSQVTDPAESNGAGGQTGTLTFTVGGTTQAGLGPASGSTQSVTLTGLLSATDGGGFYGLEAGSWSFAGTFDPATGSGSGSFTVSVPPNPIDVSEPAVLALAGIGLLGLAIARRRRA